MLNLIPVFIRKYFAKAISNGETFDQNAASADAQWADMVFAINAVKQRLEAISGPDGRLTGLTSSLAQSLAGSQRFVATASQTTYLTTIVYDATFVAIGCPVFVNGLILDPNTVTLSNVGGFLQYVIAAQTAGNIVVVNAFSSGSSALAKLNSITNGQGASLIGIEDASGFTAQINVEGALAEIYGLLNNSSFIAGVIGLSAYFKKDGSVAATGAFAMGGFKISGLAAGTASSNDAARMADITAAALIATLGASLSATYLQLAGGTMTGAIAMSNNKITGLAAATVAGDAVRFEQWRLALQADGTVTSTAAQNMGGFKITNGLAGTADTDFATVAQARSLAAPFANVSNYTTPGANSFVVPTGISQIRTEIWGGGAGGQTGGGAATGSNGGAAGGYATAVIPVTPGETLTLAIGAGGAAGVDGTDTTIQRGATVLLKASKGVGQGTGGTGGVASSPGGIPFWGIAGSVGNGGGAASGAVGYNAAGGNSPRGGSGGVTTLSSGGALAGINGVSPGGGGGGGGGTTAGTGGNGQITINY